MHDYFRPQTKPPYTRIEESTRAAWLCFLKETRTGSLNDVIEWRDLFSARENIIHDVTLRIKEENVRPTRIQIVDHPKDQINVRPLVRFSIEDRITYSALALQVGRAIDNTMNGSVHSYRWRLDGARFWNPIPSWIRMQQRGRRNLKSNKHLRLAKTDIVSFYENVDIDILVDDINALGIEGYSPRLLHEFLSGFQQVNHAWGLPQGPDVSGLLSNLYLSPIDHYLQRNNLRYLRYSDDMDIFDASWDNLRFALLDINRMMRSRRLAMASGKTKIYEPDEALSKFEEKEKDAIQYGISIESRHSRTELRAYFDKATQEYPLSRRDLKWVTWRLGKLKDEYAVNWSLRNLERNPHLAGPLFDYLHFFVDRSPQISRHLNTMIRHAGQQKNPYLEQEIIRYFLSRDLYSYDVWRLAWTLVDDRNKEGFVREHAARYIGRHARYGDGQRLKHYYESEAEVRMRRALLVAMYEANYCSNRLLQGLRLEPTEIRWTAEYLLQQPNVPLPKQVE